MIDIVKIGSELSEINMRCADVCLASTIGHEELARNGSFDTLLHPLIEVTRIVWA